MSDGKKQDLLEQFANVPLSKLPQALQEQVKSAQNIFLELSKLMKSIILYGKQHQSAILFRKKFFDALTQALTQFHVLDVEVQQYELIMADQVVFSDEKATGIYQFYMDGIRALSFKEGISLEEVDQLLNLILLDWSDPALFEDDATTLLWKCQFKSIHYRVAQVYHEKSEEIEEGKSNQSVDEILNQISSLIQKQTAQPFRAVKLKARSQVQVDQSQLQTKIHQRETLEKFVELSLLTQKSQLQLGQSGQNQQAIISQRDRLINLFDQMALVYLNQQEIGTYERLLRQVINKAEDAVKVALIEKWTVPHHIEKILLALYTEDEILMAHQFEDREKILHRIRQKITVETDGLEKNQFAPSVISILSLLNPKMIPSLSLHIAKIKAQYEKQLVSLMLPFIQNYSIELCRSLLQCEQKQGEIILSAIYQSQHLPTIAKAFSTIQQNPNTQLRYEAIKKLPSFAYATCLNSLCIAAKDMNTKTSSFALYQIALLAQAQAQDQLLPYIDQPEFQALAISDKRKYLATLAYVQTKAEGFAKMIEQGGVFSFSSTNKEDKQHAALIALAIALSFKPNAEYEQILEKQANRKFGGGLLKEAAIWGLRYLKGDQKQRDGQRFILYMLSSLDEQGK
jgi:hypothetical protein